MDAPEFQQLHRIKQLGPAYLVYPGATHTRLSHSLGVYHIAFRMVRRLLGRSTTLSISLDGVKAFLCAALLHDLGHFPFTHSFKELPLADHEHLTGRLILETELKRKIADCVGTDPYRVAAIVDPSLDDDEEIRFFRRLLSGSLDPDKLDYLNRDAYFCGVPYGVQDIDYALSRLTVDTGEGLVLEAAGISAVENILFSKYLMYRAVYWHRTVRVATAMIKKAVHLGLRDEMLSPEDIYFLDDESFSRRFSGARYRPFTLVTDVYGRNLYKSVVELPFDPKDKRHAALEDLDLRERKEAEIAGALNATGDDLAVIVDVPEAISFEVNMPVATERGYVDYPEAGTVFTKGVVHDFTANLRKIRVMVRPELAEFAVDSAAVNGFL
jgi:HD superfamily phosphohydrolase